MSWHTDQLQSVTQSEILIITLHITLKEAKNENKILKKLQA